jgi:hypothetical protein
VENGVEVPSDAVHFAYEEVVAWRAGPIEVEIGEYSIEIISPRGRIQRLVAIDQAAIDVGASSVTFTREHFVSSPIPLPLKRAWWKCHDVVRACWQLPIFDAIARQQYRRQFRRGPIGIWISSHEMLTIYGTEIIFRDDGTGHLHQWGEVDDGDRVWDDDFRWTPIGDWRISIDMVGEEAEDQEEVVEFDFRAGRSPYGHREVVMFSKDNSDHQYANSMFWRSFHPVCFVRNA